MYKSIFHWRPLVNGYSSYWPERFPARMALARRLPDRAALAALREETGVDLVLVRLGDFGLVERELCDLFHRAGLRKEPCPSDPGAVERAPWLELAARGGRDDLRLIARDRDDLLFAVAAPSR
jgi:hypothetical protein